MKKIIPFKKNLSFKTNVSEITSISLENTLHNNDSAVEGELIINGDYKITETSVNVDSFEFKVPINIEIDKKYITDNMIIDIDDFYYEIINNNILEVNVAVLLDNIVEKPIIEQVANDSLELISDFREEIDRMNEESAEVKQEVSMPISAPVMERCIEEVDEVKSSSNMEFKDIFDSINETTEEYSTYYVYIVREGDTIESILTKYNTSKEVLSNYNDLNELKLGDKIIIPEQLNAWN